MMQPGTIRGVRAVALLILLAVPGAVAQLVGGKQVVKAELVTDANDFARPFTVGIRFTIESGWYLYWRNPGDGGLPIDVQWEVPAGWKVSELQHPIPEKIAYDDLVSYGYKRGVTLLATITPSVESQNGEAKAIKARLDWLVCKESCVRGTAEVVLTTQPVAEAKRRTAYTLIRAAKDRLPRAFHTAGVKIADAQISRNEAHRIITVRFTGEKVGRVTDFFPDALEGASIEYKSVKLQDGILSLTLQPENESAAISRLKGLLMAGTIGYECVIPLKNN
jgi:thiol:disulfide interchange protein DsbD